MPDPAELLVGTAVGIAVGTAASDAIAPALEPAKQKAWADAPNKVLDAGRVAEMVAAGELSLAAAQEEASRSGWNLNRLEALIALAYVAPGAPQALELWRRGLVTEATVDEILAKGNMRPDFWAPIKALKDERLQPAQIALGIVRSLLKDPGFMPVPLDVSGGDVPSYPQSSIDPIVEAAASGIDAERLRVMVGEIGLPMSLQSAASAVFRAIINEADFNRAVLEGDTRPEWAAAILEQARQIPSVADYVNARIRGWISDDEMNAGTARHGMSPEDTHLLYLRTGRPAAPGQMATAAARGIDGPDGTPMDETQFLKGIAESDIRPEWGPMLWKSRFLYPPLFQLTRLVQANAITADTAADWAEKDRYPPDVVAALRTYWSQPASTTSKEATATDLLGLMDAQRATEAQTATALQGLGYSAAEAQTKIDAHNAKLVVAERTRVITAAHKAFTGGSLTGPEANTLLADLGFPEWTRTAMLVVWGLQVQFGV